MPSPRGIPKSSRLCPGREELGEELLERLERARAGRGGALLLTGSPGIGKTHLLGWLQGQARALGWQVLDAACPERSEGPFAPFDKALAGLSSPRERRAGGPAGPRLLGYVRALIAASAKRPILIALDDLQFADPESVGTFQVIARAVGGMPTVMVGALRASVMGGRDWEERAWSRVVATLTEEGALTSRELLGLSLEASRSVIESALGAPLGGVDADPLVRTLWERTEGNPLFLQEAAQLLLADGHLGIEAGLATVRTSAIEWSKDHGLGGLPLPPTMRRLVLDRLDPLSPSDLQLLRVAALAGSPFGALPLAGALGRSSRDVVAALSSLEKARVVRRTDDPDEEAWSFAHDLLWEVLLRESPPGDLQGLAGRLAAWWAAARPEDVETVARLFHQAQDPDGGIPWIRDAIDHALSEGATASAERFFRWYLDLLALTPDPKGERALRALDLIDRLLVRRVRPETTAILDALLRTYPGEALEWEVEWRKVHVLLSFDVNAAAARYARLAEELDRGRVPPHDRRRGELSFLRMEVAGANLRWEEVVQAAGEAESLLGPAARVWQRGRVLYEMAWALMMLDRRPEARDAIEEAQALVAGGEAPGLKASLGTLSGSMALMAGRLDEAEALYRQAADDLLALGAMEGYGIANNDLAEVRLLRGDAEGAREALADAELVGRRFGAPRVLQGCHFRLGWWHAQRGEWDLALACLGESDHTARRHGFEEGVWEDRLFHAWALLELGRRKEGAEELAAVRSHRTHLPAYFGAYLAWAEARLRELSGQSDVQSAYDRAVALAQEQAFPWVQAEVLSALATWQDRQGESALAQSARSQASALRARARGAPPALAGPDTASVPPPSEKGARTVESRK